MPRFVFTFALALFPVLAFAQTPELVEAGKLTWGISVTFPPFEFEENGKPTGFDVDLVNTLAKKMGVQPAITPIEFKGLIPALLGKRIDIIVSGMYINPQRLEVADMIPYLLIGNQIVVRAGNPKHIDGMADAVRAACRGTRRHACSRPPPSRSAPTARPRASRRSTCCRCPAPPTVRWR